MTAGPGAQCHLQLSSMCLTVLDCAGTCVKRKEEAKERRRREGKGEERHRVKERERG